MLESPAHRALSPAAIRALYRIEVELSNYGGNDNGKLLVTFSNSRSGGPSPQHRERYPRVGGARLHSGDATRLRRRGGEPCAQPVPAHLQAISEAFEEGTQQQYGRMRKIETLEQAEAIAAAARRSASPRNVERAKKTFCHPTKRPRFAPRKGGHAPPHEEGVLSRYSGREDACEESSRRGSWVRSDLVPVEFRL
jgi:hypothetical protein